MIILFAGIPATGKSKFCRYLAREYGFGHYDMECWPKGWPHRELHQVWERSRAEFVAALRHLHDNVAIDWGFPSQCRPWVAELQAAGARLVWFAGDEAHARKLYEERGGLSLEGFQNQMKEITDAGFPKGLDARVVEALTSDGSVRPMGDIYGELFPVA